MKKKITMIAIMLLFISSVMTVEAKENQKENNLSAWKDAAIEYIQKANPEKVKKMFSFVEEKIDEGKWNSTEGIEEALEEGEEEFQVTLTKSQKEKILGVVEKIKKSNIDPKQLVKQVKDIYEEYGEKIANSSKEEVENMKDEIVEKIEEAVKESVKKSVTVYFTNVVNRVKGFLKGFAK